MKKLFLIISLVFLLATAAGAQMVSVDTDGAQLREGPGSQHKEGLILGRFYPLKILDQSGDWYKVEDWFRNRGWIKKTEVSKTPTCIIKKMRINMRSGPGTGYSQVTRLYQGFIGRIIKRTKYWYKIEIVDPTPENGKQAVVGWVSRRLIWGD